MNTETILFDKDEFKFSRICKNHYKQTFSIENKNINVSKIIDFTLIKLMYDLNKDVYEKSNIEKINDNEVNVTLLMKHYFEDIGLPQRFSFVNMKKIIEEKKIIFYSQSIKSVRPPDMPEGSLPISIKNMICVCDIISPHNIDFSLNIYFDDSMIVPSFIEKIIGMISNKIFKRVKQFIENVRL